MSAKYIFAAITLLASVTGSWGKPPAGTLRIRIYDYVSVDPQILEKAEREASHLLRAAGVRVLWIDCEIRREDRPAGHPCGAPPTATDIHLRIYDRAMARRVGAKAGCVGVSFLAEGFDSIGAVFYHRATELKRQIGIPLAPILGAVIAHEVGHLLLESSNHAATGLMSANWDHQTLLRISRNQLGFARAQRERIGTQLELRIASEQRITDPGLVALMYF